MDQPKHHIFVCESFRMNGEPQGACNRQGAAQLPQSLDEEIVDRGIDAQVTTCGCLKVCDRGPAMVVYPEGWWYGNLDEDNLDTILDALEEGKCVPELMMS